MITLLIDNFDLTGQQNSYLTADAAKGATSLTVANTAGFNVNDYILLETPGTETAEIAQISAIPDTVTLTVGATGIAHDKNVVLTKTPYNQYKIYRANEKTGTYTLLDTNDLHFEEEVNLYNDATGKTANWYKVTYYNSFTTTESSINDALPVIGGVNLVADPTSFTANSYVTYQMANDFFSSRIGSDAWFESSTYEMGQALVEAAVRIDTYRYFGQKIYSKQKRQWPRSINSTLYSGSADSGSATTMTDSELANIDLYDPGEFVYWGLRMTSGDNEKEVRLIGEYDIDTGLITIDTQTDDFSNPIDAADEYQLIEKIPEDIRNAQCELAFWIVKENTARNADADPNVKSESIGDYSVTYKDTTTQKAMPDHIYTLLKKYISKSGVVLNSRSIN